MITWIYFIFLTVPVLGQLCEYCSLDGSSTLDNTYCQNPARSRSCGQVYYSDVNPQERQEILDLHNGIRRNIANGQDPNFRYTASNMQELVWDEELAHGAKIWAEQCDFRHDQNDVCRFKVGQNLYIAGTRSTPSAKWNKPVESWYDEVHLFRGNPSNVQFNSLSNVGHFTQMIWAETKYIGCHFIGHTGYLGSSNFNAEYYVCNYGPAGNYIGKSIIESGNACSRCHANQQCNNGLCSDAAPVFPTQGVTAPLPLTTARPIPPPLVIPTTTTTTTTTTQRPTAVRPNREGCEIKKVIEYLEFCFS